MIFNHITKQISLEKHSKKNENIEMCTSHQLNNTEKPEVYYKYLEVFSVRPEALRNYN